MVYRFRCGKLSLSDLSMLDHNIEHTYCLSGWMRETVGSVGNYDEGWWCCRLSGRSWEVEE
jgi:hypothetical protein